MCLAPKHIAESHINREEERSGTRKRTASSPPLSLPPTTLPFHRSIRSDLDLDRRRKSDPSPPAEIGD